MFVMLHYKMGDKLLSLWINPDKICTICANESGGSWIEIQGVGEPADVVESPQEVINIVTGGK